MDCRLNMGSERFRPTDIHWECGADHVDDIMTVAIPIAIPSFILPFPGNVKHFSSRAFHELPSFLCQLLAVLLQSFSLGASAQHVEMEETCRNNVGKPWNNME